MRGRVATPASLSRLKAIVNPEAEAEAQDAQAEMEAERATFYDEQARAAARVIGAQVDASARDIANGGSGESLSTEEINAFLRALYVAVGFHFVGRIATVLRDEPPTVDAWTARAMAYLDRVGADKVTQINDTTRDMIKRVTRDALAEGLNNRQTAKALRDKWADLSTFRSNAIARTEVISASNFATQDGVRSYAEANDLRAEKEWLPFIDTRTREDHAAAAGQRLPLDTPYSIGGASLMFPGDGSRGAPAEQVVNCRCSETYFIDDVI